MANLERNDVESRKLKGLILTYETLAGEVAERSRRVWQLGSIFVPVTFLILTQALIARASLGDLGYGIIVAAACLLYLTYAFSLKHTNNMNDVQYSRLRKVEKEIRQLCGFETKDLFGVYEWSHSQVRGSIQKEGIRSTTSRKFFRVATRLMEYFVGIPTLAFAILYYLDNPFLISLTGFILVFGLAIVIAALLSSFFAIATYAFLASSRFWSRRFESFGLCLRVTANGKPSVAKDLSRVRR